MQGRAGAGAETRCLLCAPAHSFPLTGTPRGAETPRADTGSTCGSKVQGLCSPVLAQDVWVALCSHCSGTVIPGPLPWVSPPPLAALGSPLLPPKPADQISMSSRQAGCLTTHLSQLAPLSRLLEFSWMKDAMEICNSRAQALVLVSSSALRLSSSQWKIQVCLETVSGFGLKSLRKYHARVTNF